VLNSYLVTNDGSTRYIRDEVLGDPELYQKIPRVLGKELDLGLRPAEPVIAKRREHIKITAASGTPIVKVTTSA
jgi:hypothetical protein